MKPPISYPNKSDAKSTPLLRMSLLYASCFADAVVVRALVAFRASIRYTLRVIDRGLVVENRFRQLPTRRISCDQFSFSRRALKLAVDAWPDGRP